MHPWFYEEEGYWPVQDFGVIKNEKGELTTPVIETHIPSQIYTTCLNKFISTYEGPLFIFEEYKKIEKTKRAVTHRNNPTYLIPTFEATPQPTSTIDLEYRTMKEVHSTHIFKEEWLQKNYEVLYPFWQPIVDFSKQVSGQDTCVLGGGALQVENKGGGYQYGYCLGTLFNFLSDLDMKPLFLKGVCYKEE